MTITEEQYIRILNGINEQFNIGYSKIKELKSELEIERASLEEQKKTIHELEKQVDSYKTQCAFHKATVRELEEEMKFKEDAVTDIQNAKKALELQLEEQQRKYNNELNKI